MNGLSSLSSWADNNVFFAPRSAQGYMNSERVLFSQSACGSSCGSGDTKPQPSACGAGDTEPKPSACGAGDETKPQSACGSACGAGEK
jgi:ACGX-repeat protein